jgi:Cas7 group CRISPR-associated protein Csh2
MRIKTSAEKNAELPTHTDIAYTYEGYVLIEYILSNPNGDLNAGGGPKMDPLSGHVFVSGELARRVVRDYVTNKYKLVAPFDIFIRNRETMAREDGGRLSLEDQVQRVRDEIGLGQNEAYLAGLEGAKKGKKGKKKGDPEAEKPSKDLTGAQERILRAAIFRAYFDGRVFGFMGNTGSDKMDSVKMPFVINEGISLHPVVDLPFANTRAMVSNEKEQQKRGQSIANRTVVRYALVLQKFVVTPAAARITGMSQADFFEVLEALINGWSLRTGAHRTPVLRGMWLFKQPALGRRPLGKDWDEVVEVRCKLADPIEANSFSDFEVVRHDELIPPGVEVFDLPQIAEMIGLWADDANEGVDKGTAAE